MSEFSLKSLRIVIWINNQSFWIRLSLTGLPFPKLDNELVVLFRNYQFDCLYMKTYSVNLISIAPILSLENLLEFFREVSRPATSAMKLSTVFLLGWINKCLLRRRAGYIIKAKIISFFTQYNLLMTIVLQKLNCLKVFVRER